MKRQLKHIAQLNQAGFTILESLMAMIVVAILMMSISPVIAISVATRVQARRVEIATQGVRSYVDYLRDEGAPPSTRTTAEDDKFLSSIATPSTKVGLTCFNLATGLKVVQTEGECTGLSDVLIHAFRNGPEDSTEATKRGYRLGVRVYRSDAPFNETPSVTAAKDGDEGRQQNSFTGGLGDRRAPLYETTTYIASRRTMFRDMCTRLGGCTRDTL